MPTSNSPSPPLDHGEVRQNSQIDCSRLNHWSFECFLCGESTSFGYFRRSGADRGLRSHLLKDHRIAEPRIRLMTIGGLPFEQKERAIAIAAELVSALGAGIPCPHCGAELQEKQPNERWLRHFICEDCTRAFHYVPYNDPSSRTRTRHNLEQGMELR